jgi:uncharacterized protein (DUF1697 family)
MTTHLALLRGINVSGHNMIKMEALQKMLENMGFKNVKTYIQTGNVFIDSDDENAASVGFKIKQEITKEFGYDVPVITLAKADLIACFSNNTFLKLPNVDVKKLYVAFISKELNAQAINDLKISNFKPDEAIIDKNRIFVKYDIGAGKTKLDQKYIEKKLNVIATMRNYNTISKLLEMFEDS